MPGGRPRGSISSLTNIAILYLLLIEPATTREIRETLGLPRLKAGKYLYRLKKMGYIEYDYEKCMWRITNKGITFIRNAKDNPKMLERLKVIRSILTIRPVQPN